RPSDFDLHCETVERMDEATELVAPIEARLLQEVAKAFGEDWRDTWHLGIPEWEEIPHSINVRDIVRLWTWAKALDMVEFGKWRYNMLDPADHWIPGARVQEFDTEVMLRKLADSPHAKKIVEILRGAEEMFGGEKVSRLSEG
ncbi:MAG: aldo/keto reductase, partial [Verrucomicrobiae bacterium]|nr:aldo/keto reductase [Verrucomicrobiae bacterium]